MAALILFALLFVGGHLLLSSLPVRTRLVARLGEKRYVPLYSSIALAALVGLVMSYNRAPYVGLWGEALRWLPLVVMPFAFVLFVGGMAGGNPSAVGQRLSGGDDPARGIFRITRHPAMWGFALWALAHIPPNGDLASLILFGSLATLALAGTLHQDRRKEHLLGDAWRAFERRTSHLPFRAIAEGRNKLALAEIGWVKPAIALALYAALLHLHTWLFSVSPLP